MQVGSRTKAQLRVGAYYGGDNNTPWIEFTFVNTLRPPGHEELARLASSISSQIVIEAKPTSCASTYVMRTKEGEILSRASLQRLFFRVTSKQPWVVTGQDA